MAFTKKIINVSFTLAPAVDAKGNITSQPTFAGGNNNKVDLTGYRVVANIVKGGGISSQGTLTLRVYGMSLSLMNQLSTLGKTPIYVLGPQMNQISITAGDETGTSLVFQGAISQAYTDLSGAPEAAFNISAFSLLYQAVQTIAPTSYKSPVDVATVLQSLAQQMSLKFENNGVSVILPTVYLHGSALNQCTDAIQMANIEWNQGDNGILAIWPKGGARAGNVPLISPANGTLVGYPYPSGGGLLGLKTVFNPDLVFGTKIQVETSITPAVGIWTICSLVHDIESEVFGGQWFTTLVGTPPGYLTVNP